MDLINVWALCVRFISEKSTSRSQYYCKKTDTDTRSNKNTHNQQRKGHGKRFRSRAGEMKEMPVWRVLSAHEKDGEDLSLLKGYTAPLLKPFITLWIFSFNGLLPLITQLCQQRNTARQTRASPVLLTYMSFIPTGALSFSLSVNKQCFSCHCYD